MIKKYKSYYKYGIWVLLCIVFIIYSPVFSNFFQHDEWTTFATYFTDKSFLSDVIWYFFRLNVAHYTPLHGSILYLMFKVFSINYFYYAALSIILQMITVYLVFILTSKLFKNKTLSLITSGLFAVNASSYQATSWVGTTVNTHGATIFAILSILVYLKYLKNLNKKNNYFLIFSILLLFISLLFKEITIAIFAVLILIIFLFTKKLKLRQKNIELIKLVLFGFTYFTFRASMIFAKRGDLQEQIVTESQPVIDILRNFVTFPIKIFSQGLIPTQFILKLSSKVSSLLPDSITGLYGTTAFDVFNQQIVLQIINWTLFVGAIALLYKLFLEKNKTYFKLAIFGFSFSILNSFIYIISPGRTGNIPVVDSRNIYFPAIGATIFLVSISAYFAQKYNKSVYAILVIPFLLNLYFLNKELRFYADQGTERKVILQQIKNKYPNLPNRVIFYTESDTSYYGMPEKEKIFPYELNFGYTLMVWYLPTEKYSNEMVKIGGFLYKITDQGYQEKDGTGFGYFRDLDKLKQVIKVEKLPIESVIAFKYYSKEKKLLDITDEIRKKIDNN